MDIYGKIAVITGAASGINEAVARELAGLGVKAMALVDRSQAVDETANAVTRIAANGLKCEPFVGDVTEEGFCHEVYDQMMAKYGVPAICVPAAGITRDGLAAKLDKATGKVTAYPREEFRLVTEVNLIAPVYWGLEMVCRIAQDRYQRGLKRWEAAERVQDTVIFIGSISSQGNKGQIAYAATKAGLEGAAATLMLEAMYHGVRCGVIHPGFTDTPMVRALGEQYINEHVLPNTQLRRLIRPEEIAHAIGFMVANSAVSGELWADAGWHSAA